MPRVKYPLRYMTKAEGERYNLSQFGNFGPNGNLTGMRKFYGWDSARPVKCGAYVYNVDEYTYDHARAK